MTPDSPENYFTIPERVGDMTGGAFASTIIHVPAGSARELAIYQQFELGNVPDFMRTPKRLTMSGGGCCVEVDVLPDILCIGTDEDFLRVVMMPTTAQRVADLFSASLITPFLSDQVWRQADVHINPLNVTMPPTLEMTSTKWFVDQDAKVEKARSGRKGLIAGHKKDIVIANSLSPAKFKDRKVAIYGWHQTSGVPIQGLNPSENMPEDHTHSITYVDYSHGVRLVSECVIVNGVKLDIVEAMQDAAAAPLLNGVYGPLTYARYPT